LTTTRSKPNSAPSAGGWRSELRRTVERNRYIPVTPTPRQGAFLAFPTLEVGYGGAAGGGKSVALLMAALQYVGTPGYNALLIRRTFADLNLPDALIPLSHQWLAGTDARWNGQDHKWTFPSGATLTFGYCESANDVYRYQGAALAYVGWDELTQFPEQPYRYLFSRLRKRADLPVPLRVRAGFNPGGIGHDWVRARFIDGQTVDRRFVPAKLEDNPHLDREEYERSLDLLDPVTKAQLRHSDWDVRPEGNLFKREWFSGKVEDAPPAMRRRVRFWDLAATEAAPGKDPDYTASVLMGLDTTGGFWVLDATEFRATPADVEARVAAQASIDGRAVEIHMEQEPGASGKSMIDHYARTVLPGYDFHGVKSTGDKITRAKPFSAACQNGLVRLVRGTWVGRWIDNLTSFGLAGVHDDMADASAGAHHQLTDKDEPWGEQDVRRAFDGPGESLDDPSDDAPAMGDPFQARLLAQLRGTGSLDDPNEI
jgi:predicted phage terminase large subunit-like protein